MHAGAPPRAGHAAAAAYRVRGGACAGLAVREQAQEGRLRSESRYSQRHTKMKKTDCVALVHVNDVYHLDGSARESVHDCVEYQ